MTWAVRPFSPNVACVTIPAMVGGTTRDDGKEPELVIDWHELRCGGVSVGLPPGCSVDTVLRRYGDLLAALGLSLDVVLHRRQADLEILGRVMGLGADAVRNRLFGLLPAAA